ncbi:MAG: segregation protein [Chloroflexi bacterium]|nr:segregation protein [Chloroflexota bacterium]
MDPNLLVGINTADDAGVYRLSAELALVQTVDFFTPVVDDPYWFGAIAAANALSDIYAMGGKPLTALNIVGFPASTLPLDVLAEILRGGADKVREAGATIVGGHTVDDDEPKFGLAVTGLIDPRHIIVNAGGKPGDVLVLTKPLGSGIATTAIKRGLATDHLRDTVTALMATLNRAASEAMLEVGANAATDITGFGLLGHLAEMTAGSGIAATVSAGSVPILEGVLELAGQDVVPGGTRRNLEGLEGRLAWDPSISEPLRLVLADAQTSGGLLIAVPEASAARLLAALLQRGVQGSVIGRLHDGPPNTISVIP